MIFKEDDTLGRYTIKRLIGRGGWGEVYEAVDPELDRRIALKLLTSRLALDPDMQSRFAREARTVAALDHPNIVTIHSVEEVDGHRFITMQLVRGQTLSELIPESGMALKELFEVAIPLADAVAAAHAKGVTHRDLKPANVMVAEDGQVKVLDFGLAKLIPEDDGETLVSGPTPAGSVMGTLNYMSPEQLRGEEADQRSDIFSLGVVLYEMATGALPFQGRSSLDVAASILRDRPTDVTTVRRALPNHLGRIIRNCLHEDANRRHQSALHLRNELQNLRDELDSGISPVGRRDGLRRWRLPLVAAVVALLVVLGSFLAGRSLDPTAPAESPTAAAALETSRIVVLPFEDLGEPAVDYFAPGLTEEISSRLAAVDSLGVISRISANQYAGTSKTTSQIGEELQVAYILRGSVQWAPQSDEPSRVRILPNLIRVADDTQIWTEPYDGSVDDIFQVQSRIASRVAEQLGRRLAGGPDATAEVRPTESLEAYQAYLRGLYYASRPVYTMDNYRQAIDGLSEAVALDPEFAVAWARLARSHSLVYQIRLDLSQERRDLAREALERAMALAPDDPAVRLALGYYNYEIVHDFDRALEEFEFVEALLPNSYEVHEAKGYVLRRQGRWQDARDSLQRAFELNPRDSAMAAEVAETYAVLRDYDEAIRIYDQAIALDPEQVWAYVAKAWAHWLRGDELSAARATLELMPPTDDSMAVWAWFWQEVYEGSPARALARLPADPAVRIESSDWSQPSALLAAQAHELAGDSAAARTAYETAVELLRAAVEALPDDPRQHLALGLSNAGLGRKEAALSHSRHAVSLQPISKDAFSGSNYLRDLALVYARTGELEQSVELLEQLLSSPTLLSPAWLRLDPRWRPLAASPRFQELTAG